MKNTRFINIKTCSFFLVLGLFLSYMLGCASASKSIEIPAYKTKTLKNGLQVLLFKDSKLPLVSIQMSINLGAVNDPVGKTGLTSMTAQLLDRGSKTKSATELADAFANLGTNFSVDPGFDFTVLSTSGLAETQDELFKLFTEVALEPAFANSEVIRIKNEQVAGVKRGYDQPSYVAGLVFSQALFNIHPYGRSDDGTIRDINSVRQKDVIRHYLKYFRPNNAILAVVGDVDMKVFDSLMERLETWEQREVETQKLPVAQINKGMQLTLVDRPDLQQSEVRIGHIGVKRNDPDYLALSVIDTILSGGFNSRLMKEIRVKRGLTYGISSDFNARREPGAFFVAAATRHEKVGELVAETMNQVRLLVGKGITKEELDETVGYLKGTFPRRFETIGQMAGQIVSLNLYGLDISYLKNYMKNLNDLDVEQVNAIMKKHIRYNDFNIVVYAPKDKVLPQLRPIGAVSVKSYKDYL
jgi:zinc protease